MDALVVEGEIPSASSGSDVICCEVIRRGFTELSRSIGTEV